MKIALAGATGLTGSFALQSLITHSEVERVFVLTRRSLQAIASPKIVEVRLDPHASGLELPSRVDGFVGCLGTTLKKAGSREAFRAVDHDLSVSLARLARESGARSAALISAIGAHPRSRIFYNRVKGETEAAFEALGFDSLTLLRPSLLLGQRAESRLAETLAMRALAPLRSLLHGPLEPYRPIEAERVAIAATEAVLHSKPGTRILTHAEMYGSSPAR